MNTRELKVWQYTTKHDEIIFLELNTVGPIRKTFKTNIPARNSEKECGLATTKLLLV